MKRMLAAVLLLAVAPTGASADPLYPAALSLEAGYASGPPQGFPWSELPGIGSPLTMVGRVAGVDDPFTALLPAVPHEITYVFEGSSCTQAGLWDDFVCAGGIFGRFEGGTVAFYLDTTPDADFFDPASFRDGELVLLAQSTDLYVTDNDPHLACPSRPDEPDLNAFFWFVGGTWFPYVSSNGDGMSGVDWGELDNDVPLGLQFFGYIFRVEGTVDIDGPVAVVPRTWGGVKALYR